MKRFQFKKYYEIILSVALFVVLDAGVLILNYYTSFQIADDAHAIQLASRQSTLSQQILHQLYQVRDSYVDERESDEMLTKLTKSYTQFDEALDSFIYGGVLIGRGQGQDSLLTNTSYAKLDGHMLNDIQALWQPYRTKIGPVIYSSYGPDLTQDQFLQKLDVAIAYGATSNDTLLTLLTDFARAIEDHATYKAQRLRLIQAVGIGLAIINFFIILFHFLRKLRMSDRLAENARQETVEILHTVQDGLFLLDRELCLGSQYSSSLTRLIGNKQIAGENFIELLEPLVSKSDLSTAKDYLEAMFAEHVNPDLLNDLNPLDQVQVNLADDRGYFETRYFAFKFTPVRENNVLIHLLATANDITERVKLRRELEKSKDDSSFQLEQLLSVLHVDPTLLVAFLADLDTSFDAINTLLRRPADTTTAYKRKLQEISRVAHKIKGESTALGMRSLEIQIHEFEDIIEQLNSQDNISGNDFLSLTVALNKLHVSQQSLRSLASKFDTMREELNQAFLRSEQKHRQDAIVPISSGGLKPIFENLVRDMSLQLDKQVALDLTQFDESLLPDSMTSAIKDSVIQLLRNAVVHGIENQISRKASGKPPKGIISLSTESASDSLTLVLRDDGRGIDLQSIKDKLISHHGMPEKKVNVLKPSQLVKYLFVAGFTTSNTNNRHAGRGVGLDLVKKIADENGMRLSVKFECGMYTEFKLRLDTQSGSMSVSLPTQAIA